MPKALGYIARSATIIIMMFGSYPATGGELINNEPGQVTTVHSLQYAADVLEGGYQIPITYEDPDITTLASIQPLSFVVVTQHISSQVPVTEGTGLLLRKRWAEYFTIITTAGLIPLEVYELQRHFTNAKIAVLIVNAAIVAYLVVHVRRKG